MERGRSLIAALFGRLGIIIGLLVGVSLAAGPAMAVPPTSDPIRVPLFRMWNPTIGDHFYTTSAPERYRAIARYGYTNEGVAARVYATPHFGTTPLFRLWSPSAGDHFYTTSVEERDRAIARYGYTSEGITAWVYASSHFGTTPLFRLWNPVIRDHFYTTSAEERDNAITRYGYINEGVACEVFPA
jgi:hypothetical protein